MRRREPALDNIAVVAASLGRFLDAVTFTGGATIPLYIDDPAAAPSRPTLDVDRIVDITTSVAMADFDDKLRSLGFAHVTGEGQPICRFKVRNVVVDVMPTGPHVYGFTNRWYAEAHQQRVSIELPTGESVYVLSLAHLVATKWEAFLGRGRNDRLASHDLEDIVALADGASTFKTSLAQTHGTLREFLTQRFDTLLKHPDVRDIVAGLLPPDAKQSRVERAIALFSDW